MDLKKHWIGWTLALLVVVLALGSAGLDAQVQSRTQTFVFGSGEDSWLGVRVMDVTASMAKAMKLPGDYGAIVDSVEPHGPAAKAGIKKGDVILDYAGQRVFSVAALTRMVRETPPQREVKVEISRDGATKTLQVTVAKAPGNTFYYGNPLGSIYGGPSLRAQPGPQSNMLPRYRAMPIPNPQSPWPEFNFRYFNAHPVLGISGADLTPQLAKFFGVNQGKGVLVTEVTAGSPASMAGLKAGDVITKVNSQEVGTLEELRNALEVKKTESRKVLLTIVRNHGEQAITVNLKPIQPEMKSAQAWNNLGLTRRDAERLAALAAQERMKSEIYQKQIQLMQKRLMKDLQPLKEELRGEVDQINKQSRNEILHSPDLNQQSGAGRTI